MIPRRRLLGAMGCLLFGGTLPSAQALTAGDPVQSPSRMLDGEQSDRFRHWVSLIVAEQIKRGPSPRWFHRDCAGLLRFAVTETLRPHDARWRQANGFDGRRLPPELDLLPEQQPLRDGWVTLEGDRQNFVTAQALIHKNSRFLGRESAMAKPGDLLFYDQGDDQHLMIWMGSWIAYHTGQAPTPADRTGRQTTPISQDNGLRAVTPAQLLQWKDTRWRPRDDNPNFAGFFRLAFLSR